MSAGLLLLPLALTSVMGQTGLSDRVTAPARSGSWRWPTYKLERERVAVALPAPPAMSTTKKFSDRLKRERTEQTLQASGNEAFFSTLNPSRTCTSQRISIKEFVSGISLSHSTL